MGFFQKLKNGITRFMYGRHGLDQLGLALLWGAIIIDILSRFIKSNTLRTVIALLSTVMAVFAIVRMLSKDLSKRRAENGKFLEKVWWPLQRKNQDARQRAADKDHKYFTCPTCRTVCRVPKGKGKIVITCPKCGGQIKGKS